MVPNPILKVLSTFRKFDVRCLLIGGQACIIYGAAEFSRDSDFMILANPENLDKLGQALDALKAKTIYVPELTLAYLKKGHACHFRCEDEDVKGLRIDVLSKMRGCDPFEKLWGRRKTVPVDDITEIDVIGLEDLVQSKKTQRDKDWLMVKQLVENDILLNRNQPTEEKIRWWCHECRNPDALIALAKRFSTQMEGLISQRELLKHALTGNARLIVQGLYDEEHRERQEDIEYWKPLRKELEVLRHQKKD